MRAAHPLTRPDVIARETHKWLGLFIGVQVVIWSLSGLYMTAIHIDIIHGDHLVREMPPVGIEVSNLIDPLTAAAANGAREVRLTRVRNQPAYGHLEQSRFSADVGFLSLTLTNRPWLSGL